MQGQPLIGVTLASSSANAFDLAGTYPLKLRVTGVLAKAHSPDDHAVFVDLQTAWIIEGLGHGHAETQTVPVQPLTTVSPKMRDS